MRRLFADSYYYLALYSKTDSAHLRAKDWSLLGGLQMVTTEFVLLEVGDAFSHPLMKPKHHAFMEGLRSDKKVLILAASSTLFNAGIGLHRARKDQSWSVTDCISFAVMNEYGLVEALTGDRHFEQAGFKALLKAP